MADLRDRRLTEPGADQPFDHEHYGDWVPMQVVRCIEVEREGWIRREVTFACPSCTYELTESTPIRAVDLTTA